MTKYDWNTYKTENASILSNLGRFTILQISTESVFNIEKYIEITSAYFSWITMDKKKDSIF
jgi:hypothetical protein